jgi:hypothetical protein
MLAYPLGNAAIGGVKAPPYRATPFVIRTSSICPCHKLNVPPSLPIYKTRVLLKNVAATVAEATTAPLT